MKALKGEYYAECNQVFRQSTTQNGLMLEHIKAHCREAETLKILSVGSGTGLFELPMLRELMSEGIEIRAFAGLDVNEAACRILQAQMLAEFGEGLPFRIVHGSFQDYESTDRFDLVLFNHTFEYLGDRHLDWLEKSTALLNAGGSVVIFSPDGGGINQIYAEYAPEVSGFTPFFSEDLMLLFDQNGISFESLPIDAMCDISFLDLPERDPAKNKLLSFLTQIDCRSISPSLRDDFIAHFKTLDTENQRKIPHPATCIALKPE